MISSFSSNKKGNDNDEDSLSLLETIPTECFNIICLHLPITDVIQIGVSSKKLASITTSGQHNDPLWNLLLCHRLWTVDPTKIIGGTLVTTSTRDSISWKDRYKAMVAAEKRHQQYLRELLNIDLEGWLERHFIGQIGPQWNGWERRYWSWSSQHNTFAAWADDTKRHCYANFPLSASSEVRRVSEQEQIDLTTTPSSTTESTTTTTKLDDRRCRRRFQNNNNPVTDPKPYVFTVTNTTFDMLWACDSEEQMQLWLDKINVTLHPLKFGPTGRAYKAPAKYLLKKNNN